MYIYRFGKLERKRN